ncbi:Serine carboxypeptidase-like 3 [Gossypium arboreum]|uniref:Serine carboxypeptidase-like 3 n=1 Tax=Gossypium arboreum TaxID=29729 RepID=A0A0B0NA83_GOSAR|nr:Serine carboxypeptidase-like 3 [Gossypium arboreum]
MDYDYDVASVGTIKEWVRCNKSMDYDYDVASVVSYHLCLNTRVVIMT